MNMRTLKHMIRLLTAIPIFAAAVLVSSCNGDEGDGPALGADAGQPVSLRIAVGREIASRAIPTPTDDDEIGSTDENHIDIANGNFRILFFDTGNKFLSMLEPQDITLEPQTTDERIYNVKGTLNEPLPGDFKIVVLANYGSDNYPKDLTAGQSSISDACKAIYDYPSGFEPNAKSDVPKVIPMYGIKTCTGISFTHDLLSHLGTIDMLRAMAKVEIACADENIVITKAVINCVNSSGYCAPSGMYDNTANVTSLHIPTDATVSEDTKDYGSGAKKIAFYIPEFDNSDSSAKIELTFKTTTTGNRTGTIFIQDYTSDTPTPFDIARNYIYRFTVQLRSSLEVQYTVCPWNENPEILIPDFD